MFRSALQGELSPATPPGLLQHLTSVLLPTLDLLVPPQVPQQPPPGKKHGNTKSVTTHSLQTQRWKYTTWQVSETGDSIRCSPWQSTTSCRNGGESSLQTPCEVTSRTPPLSQIKRRRLYVGHHPYIGGQDR